MEFTWDETKREKVLAEHKIDFAKIFDVFEDVFSMDYQDSEHSDDDELRYGIIGKTAEYGLVAAFYTLENETTIRFITARKAEKWMVNDYEEQRRRY